MYQLVIQEEKQRSLSAMSQINSNATPFHVGGTIANEHSALAVQHKNYAAGSGYYRGGTYNTVNAGNLQSNTQTGGFHSGSNTSFRPSQRSTGQDKRLFYCDHCKITGHTIQRCYKIHGYAPGHRLYKGKRVAAAVHNEQPNYSPVVQSSSAAPPLTSEQHTQLMQLLSKYSSDMNSNIGSEDIGAAGFLAGKGYCMVTFFAHKTWILDSGASDHITLTCLYCIMSRQSKRLVILLCQMGNKL